MNGLTGCLTTAVSPNHVRPKRGPKMADSKPICSVEECNKPASAMGLCRPHYRINRDSRPDRKLCAVHGCEGVTHTKGYCGKHAYKFRTYGDPLAGRTSAPSGAPLAWIQEHKGAQQDECLVWPYEISSHGYGVLKRGGKKRIASREMCEAAHGKPPSKAMDAAHSCHNRACCNPRHLRWATRSENNLDMFKDGTAMCGEKVAWAKLTEAQVWEIRRLSGKPHGEIAAAYGVESSTISRILSRKRWGWLRDEDICSATSRMG